MDTMFQNSIVHESNPINPGEKTSNMRATYFNMWLTHGDDVDASISKPVKEAGKAYETYKAKTLKRSGFKSGDKPPTDAEERTIQEGFWDSLRIYREGMPLKGKK
jgi:hypothetical protein